MTQIQVDAVRKLQEADLKGSKLNDMQRYLAPYVAKHCAQFCEQSESFAKAVMEEKKTLVGCLQALQLPGRGMGYCSDFDVYRMAAQYFFPEADVEWTMKISVPSNSYTCTNLIELKMEDLFDFGGLV